MIRRLLPVLLLAVCVAPGTWLRTPTGGGLHVPITLAQVKDEPGAQPPAGWSLEGVWEYEATGLMFGGFSALMALEGDRLRAFSDRGARFTFREPDRPQDPVIKDGEERPPWDLARQLVNPDYVNVLWDIESATRDPETGQYWLGFESLHAFHRFSVASEIEPVRIIDDEVNWTVNSGAEAMVRLRDGRFVIIPEGGGEGLIYASDPVEGGEPATFTYEPPIRGYGITEAKELPDGRLILIVRKVVWGVPPFEAWIAIAELPGPGEPQKMRPEFIFNLTEVVPAENYEGLALRERADGAVDVWVISDDNLSVMQRTLVAKLRFDPEAAAKPAKGPAAAKSKPEQAKQKARE